MLLGFRSRCTTCRRWRRQLVWALLKLKGIIHSEQKFHPMYRSPLCCCGLMQASRKLVYMLLVSVTRTRSCPGGYSGGFFCRVTCYVFRLFKTQHQLYALESVTGTSIHAGVSSKGWTVPFWENYPLFFKVVLPLVSVNIPRFLSACRWRPTRLAL